MPTLLGPLGPAQLPVGGQEGAFSHPHCDQLRAAPQGGSHVWGVVSKTGPQAWEPPTSPEELLGPWMVLQATAPETSPPGQRPPQGHSPHALLTAPSPGSSPPGARGEALAR